MCAVWSARIHVWRGDLDHASRLMESFLPRARQHAVIQQVGPALIVAGLIATASGRADRGRRVRGGVLRADGRHAGVPPHGDRRRRPPPRRRIPNRSRRRRGRQRGDSHVPQRVRVAHRRSHVGAGAWRCRTRSRSSARLPSSGGRSVIRSRNTLHSSLVDRPATGRLMPPNVRDNSPPSLRLASESVAALGAHHAPMSA